MAGLRITLLGSPRVEVDGAPLQVDTRKAVALLAVLALDGPQSREALAALLWPDSETSRARGALRRTLSVVSKALSDRWLVADRTTVSLDLDDQARCDVVELAALTATHAHAGDGDEDEACAECTEALRQAVELYRGDLLEGFALRDSPEFDDWRAEREEHLRRELCRALDRLTRAEVAAGDLDAALVHLERWLEIDGLNERVHAKLMLLHGWRGERTEAINRYRVCVKVLERELGVTPLPRTTELYRAIVEDRLPPRPGSAPAPAAAMAGQPAGAAPDAARRDIEPAAGGDGQWPLVGRAQELARLRRAHAAGGGQLVAITGEAGIGKTRLVDELVATLASDGVRVAGSRCYPGEVALAFGPIVGLLQQAIGDAPRSTVTRLPPHVLAEVGRLVPGLVGDDRALADLPPLDSPGAQAQLFEAVWEALDTVLAGTSPGVVVIDDFHAVDASSLDLVAYGLHRLAQRDLVVVVCLRREDAREQVLALLDDPAVAARTHTLALDRLARSDVAALVAAACPDAGDGSALAARLHDESEGLPLLAVEYLRLLIDADTTAADDWRLPRGARDLARTRLATVSDTGLQIASAAAAIGRSFDLATVRYASGRSDEELVDGLEELIARRLVRELTGDRNELRYDFVHDKLRAAIYDETSLARRRLLHGRVADALVAAVRRGREVGGMAAVVAEQARLAGRDDQAAEWSAVAGAHAQTLFANQEALTHFERALALGHPDTAALHSRIGQLRMLHGDYDGAMAELEAAAAQADDDVSLAAAEHQLGALHIRLGDLEAAVAHLRTARDLIGPDARGDAARVEADLGLARLRGHDVDGAAEHAAAALELAAADDDVEAEAQALNLLGVVARHRGAADEARYHLGRSTALAEQLDDPAAHIAALNNLALATADTGAVDAAITIMARAVDLGAARGDRHREAALHNNLADLLHASGRDGEAMRELELAVALFAEVGESERPRPEIWKLVDW